MKKKLFLLSIVAAGTLVATGCSEKSAVETPESTPGAISFRTTHDFAKTRGAEETTVTVNRAGQKITVWGEQQTTTVSMLINGIEFVHDGTPANHFKSTTPYYWPLGNEDVKFWAVKNNYSGTPNVKSSTQTTIDNFVVAKAHSRTEAMTDLQKDLITAYNVGKKSTKESTGMDLQFQHALSQIEFKAINPASSTYDVYVAGVALYHIAGTGTLKFQSVATNKPTWSGLGAADTYYHNIGSVPKQRIAPTATALTQGAGAGSNFMLIPQQITGYSDTQRNGAFARVFIRVVDKVSGNVLHPTSAAANQFAPVDIPLQNITWEAGKKYVYTLNFGTGWGNKPFIPTPTPTPTPNPGVNPTPVITPVPGPGTPTPTPIAGQPIFFKVTVSNFGNGATQNLNM